MPVLLSVTFPALYNKYSLNGLINGIGIRRLNLISCTIEGSLKVFALGECYVQGCALGRLFQ